MSRTAVAYLAPPGPLELEPGTTPSGLTVVATVVEAGPDRQHLGAALDHISVRDADTLLLVRLRSAVDSLGELVALLDWLEQAGASLLALDHGLDTATGRVRDVTALLRAIEAWEHDRGPHRPPRGRPGLGHADPALAERIAALRARGLSLQAIARELNAADVPTPRGGQEWRPSSVQAALGYRRPRPPLPGAPPPKPGKPPKPAKGKGPKHKPPKHR
ncbi:MAG TPA: recombinase family protein [Solirubrobacteraceae bacterium]|jgi:DNA invertase Pin-like site-specific DNA recombinase|nr:recombinase family protein [Solirubrobacteraceae bacterium]